MRVLFASLIAATVLSACAGRPLQTAAIPDNLPPAEKLAALCQSRALTAGDKAICEKNLREATAEEMPAAVKLTEERIAMRTVHRRERRQGWESMANNNNNNDRGYNGYTSQGAYQQAISPQPRFP